MAVARFTRLRPSVVVAFDTDTRKVSCTRATLASGATAEAITVTVGIPASASGTISNTATVAAMLPVDASTATTEIAKARSEFIAATELLRNAPQATNRIRQELQLADGQWVFFDAALQRMQGGGNVNRQVAEVYVASENLLSSMDRVTGMYAALAA